MARTRVTEKGIKAESFDLPVTLNGTDGSSTDADDNIVLDASASGVNAGERLLYEGIPLPAEAYKMDSMSVVVFTDSGTWTKPSNLLCAIIEVQGGGGGGGGTINPDSDEAGTGTGGGGGGAEVCVAYHGPPIG